MTTNNPPTDPTQQQVTTSAPQSTSGARPCECSQWADPDGVGTGCTRTTRRIYAQGHDARLASWLVGHQAAGRQVRRGDGVPVTPAEAGRTVGLRYDIEAKAARLASRKQRKTRKPEQPPDPRPVTAAIKVGRWSFDNATIAPSGEASYTTKDGKTKTAAAGSYKVLLAEVGTGAE
jgi:hypothetical protein